MLDKLTIASEMPINFIVGTVTDSSFFVMIDGHHFEEARVSHAVLHVRSRDESAVRHMCHRGPVV